MQKIELAELSGVNYDELRGILNEAISGIESARTTYYDLKNLAAITPYNQSRIDALKSFDYTGFIETHRLNKEIFSKLEALLSSGNDL